jgi:hypothetical protein
MSTTMDAPSALKEDAEDTRLFNIAPNRTLQQRYDALAVANEIRTKRAQLKRDIKAGRTTILVVLNEMPDYVHTMKLFDLLLAAPKFGRVKANKIIQRCRISPSKTLGGMSERQRQELMLLLTRK